MIEPFEREPNEDPAGLTLTTFIPVAKEGAEWFFTEPSVATREYNGYLMRQTDVGWEYHNTFEATDDESVWLPVYPKVNYLKQALQVLQNEWKTRNSPFLHVQEFEDAESPFTDEYEKGEYWLVPGEHPQDNHTLVPVNKAEQLSNINALDLHLIDEPKDVFIALQQALKPMRDDIYGVIFTNENGQRARIRPRDFDWSNYDTTRSGD